MEQATVSLEKDSLGLVGRAAANQSSLNHFMTILWCNDPGFDMRNLCDINFILCVGSASALLWSQSDKGSSQLNFPGYQLPGFGSWNPNHSEFCWSLSLRLGGRFVPMASWLAGYPHKPWAYPLCEHACWMRRHWCALPCGGQPRKIPQLPFPLIRWGQRWDNHTCAYLNNSW